MLLLINVVLSGNSLIFKHFNLVDLLGYFGSKTLMFGDEKVLISCIRYEIR